MLRAVIWKEIREQGLIGLSLVVLGSGVIAAAATLADPPGNPASSADVVRSLGAGLLSTLMLSVTAGMVCGGAVFAAEREAGTMAFLDSLPGTRAQVWRSKLAAGVLLAASQIAVLLGVAAALGLLPGFGWARAIAVFALLAFVWGVFGSTLSRTTLGSVGVAIPSAALASVVVLVPILLLSRGTGAQAFRGPEAALFLVGMFALPLALSAWLFTQPDRARASDDDAGDPTTHAERDRRSRLGGRALVWLTLRQLRAPGAVLAAFALVFGLSLLPAEVQLMLTWPGLALAAGVLTGVTAFADEQTRGSARFWGEQRLPVGRVWLVKVGLHALACVGLLLLLAAPTAIRSQFQERASLREHTLLGVVFRTTMLDELSYQGWKYLLVPAAYGFAAGHLCGLTFRKLVVACGVAGIVGGVGAVGWGPSLLAGGLAHWQVWLPPAVLLVTARLMIPAWASDRVLSTATLARLAGGCAAAALLYAAGIGWRVLGVPDNPDGEADLAYVAGLPPFDTNRGGASFRTSAERFARVAASLPPELELPPQPGQPARRVRVEDRLGDVLVRGWAAAGDDELAGWLDRAFVANFEPGSDPWHAAAAEAATHPVGIYEYPQLIGSGGVRDVAMVNAHRMASALLVRGLQRQAAGDPEPFVTAFRTAVVLARTVRNGSVLASFQLGRGIEENALYALDRWLEAQPPQAAHLWAALAPFPALAAGPAAAFERPDLMRQLVAALEPGDPDGPFDPTPYFLAERYVIREMMKAPAQWLPQVLRMPVTNQEVTSPEIDLVATAWAVPWERERTRRLLGLGYEAGPSTGYGFIAGRPGAGILIRPRIPDELVEIDRGLRGHRRAAILKVALRAYRAERGAYPDPTRPDPLGVLVEEKYLRRLPPDAFDEAQPYGYRISPPGGETLRPRPRVVGMRAPRAGDNATTWVIPEGQAVLWSRIGRKETPPPGSPRAAPAGSPDDLIYLVPMGANP